jgi:hypothetical protein
MYFLFTFEIVGFGAFVKVLQCLHYGFVLLLSESDDEMNVVVTTRPDLQDRPPLPPPVPHRPHRQKAKVTPQGK